MTVACVWTEREGGSNEEPGKNGDSAGPGIGGEAEPGSPRRVG